MIRPGVPQTWSLSQLLLATLGGLAGLVLGHQLAWAHGSPPAVLGALQSPAGQLAAVRLSRGLAVQQAGQWRFVCPSRWAGQPQPTVVLSKSDGHVWLLRNTADWRPPGPGQAPAPTQTAPAGVQVLAADGHWLQSLPLPAQSHGVTLVDGPDGPVLVTTGSGTTTHLWTAAGAGWQPLTQAAISAQTAVYLPPQASSDNHAGIWLAEAVTEATKPAGGSVTLRLARSSAVSDVVYGLYVDMPGPATVRLTVSGGLLWATIRTATADKLGLIDLRGPYPVWQPLFADAPPLSEPVVYADQLWITRAGVIGSVAVLDKGDWQTQPFAVADNRRWYTCLQPGPGGEVSSNLVCARTQLFSFAPPDAPPAAGQAPRFEILALQPPDYNGLTGSLLYGCWLEWLDLATDSGLNPGADPTQPAVITQNNAADASGCHAARKAPAMGGATTLYLGVLLLGVLVRRRLVAQGRGSVGNRRGAAT